MADSSQIPSDDDEGDDGDEGEEEGDADESIAEGETPGVDNSISQDQDQEMADAGASEVIRPSSIEEPGEGGATNEEDITARSRLGSSLAPPTLGSLASTRLEGSPLKNVMIRSPTEPPESRSDVPGVDGSFFPSTNVDLVKTEVTSAGEEVDAEGNTLSAALLSETVVEAEQSVVDAVNETTAMDIDIAAEQQQQQPPESVPSADATVEDLEAALSLPGLRPDAPTSVITSATSTMAAAESSETTITATESTSALIETSSVPADATMEEVDVLRDQLSNDAAPTIVEPLLQPPDSPALLPTATTEDEDDGLNLLGSLERELDRQEEEASRAGSAASGAGAGSGAGAATEGESNGGDADNKKDASASTEEKPLLEPEAEATSAEAGGSTTKSEEVGIIETTTDTTTNAPSAVGEEEKPSEEAASGTNPAESKENTANEQEQEAQKKEEEEEEEGSASTAAPGDSAPKESESSPAESVQQQQVAEPSNQNQEG